MIREQFRLSLDNCWKKKGNNFGIVFYHFCCRFYNNSVSKMDKGSRGGGGSNVVTGDVEAVPVLHSIMQRVDAPSEEEVLPSTVDIAALKVRAVD